MTAKLDVRLEKNQQDVQEKLCFLNEQLQSMVDELPQSLKQKFSFELIRLLANALVDDTIYGIMLELMNIQHQTEIRLCNYRLQLMKKHAAELQTLKQQNLSKPKFEQVLQIIRNKYDPMYYRFDEWANSVLDGKKKEQQELLVMEHIPGFEITDDPEKIIVQTKIIDFILRLSHVMKNWTPKNR